MKSKITFISLLLFLSAASVPLFAAEDDFGSEKEKKSGMSFSAGAQVLYSWWDPVWKKKGLEFGMPFLNLPSTYKLDPAMIYSPVVALRINPSWSVSASFYYGVFKASITKIAFQSGMPGLPNLVPLPEKAKTTKIDSDILVSYNTNKYMKLFFGPKYQGFKLSGAPETTSLVSLGGGMAFSIPLVADLFLQPSLSLLALYGRFSIEGSYAIRNVASGGCNAGLTLAYFIAPISSTISIGYKGQYLYYFNKPNPSFVRKHDLQNSLLASVIYTF